MRESVEKTVKLRKREREPEKLRKSGTEKKRNCEEEKRRKGEKGRRGHTE